ncbi:MAG: glycerol-3-phosphate acyltransferase [Ignavibacteriales bacterium]|nr:glycerol-3-phosphate acyltransferase [Ignavibacteriales bacterium]
MEFLYSFIIGYISGSIPTAYLILKKVKGIDITNAGSGNVGAMNSFEVTRSKGLGFLVFFIDFLKGIVPVLIVFFLFNFNFSLAAITLIFSIFSHCFNPWIGFKGGRGLATAAGGIAILFPILLFAWIAFWIITYLIKKDILISNISATIMAYVFVLIFNNQFIEYAYPQPVLVNELLLFTSALLIIIFIKHIEPLKDIISKKKP